MLPETSNIATHLKELRQIYVVNDQGGQERLVFLSVYTKKWYRLMLERWEEVKSKFCEKLSAVLCRLAK